MRLTKIIRNLFLNKEAKRIFSSEDSVRPFESIPGPRSLPLIGTLWLYLPWIGRYSFQRLHWNGFKKLKEFGPVVREEMVPGVPVVWVFKPEDIEMVYRCEGRYPERRSHLAMQKYRLDRKHCYNSGGLLPTNGPEWGRLRRIFQTDLNKIENVRLYLSKHDAVVKDFLDKRVPNYKDDFLPELSRLYLELTALVSFDECMGSFNPDEIQPDSKTTKLIEAATTINGCILATDNGPQLWKKFDTRLYRKMCRAHYYIETIAKNFINKKLIQLKDKSNKLEFSLLEQYLSNPKLDKKDVLGMSTDMLLAGIDTMAYTNSFALYHLATNLEKQEIMFRELQKLMDPDTQITEEMLQNIPYTRAVIKEVFRLSPISVGIGRILAKDAVFSGFLVPKGTVVVTQNQVSSRLPEYFRDPNSFIPERWLKDSPRYENPNPYLVLPFGHGPRTCIARRLAEQNFQLFLMNIVRRYKMFWEGGILDCTSIQINKPDKDVRIRFEKRF